MSVVVIATVHGLTGRAAEVRRAVEEVARATRSADGCEAFHVGQDLDDPGQFVLVTTWRDEATMRAHFSSDAYGHYVDAVTPALARPSDVTIHYADRTIHPVGDASTEAGRQG